MKHEYEHEILIWILIGNMNMKYWYKYEARIWILCEYEYYMNMKLHYYCNMHVY